VDGGPIPANMIVDYIKGEVHWDDQNNLGPPGPYTFVFQWERPLDFQKTAAKQLVERKTESKRDALDETFVGGSLIQDFMTQEVLFYEWEGRPVSPSSAVYSTAATLQSIRGDVDLRDTLEWMRTKYLALKLAANTIIGERFEFLTQINTASDIPTLEATVVNIKAW
jgi:hypothetical protein